MAGTSGAFASSSAISRWGNNYSFFLTPVFFTFAGGIWMFISVLNHNSADEELEQAGLSNVDRAKKPTSNYFVMVFRGVLNFGESMWVGARLIFGNRCFICEYPITSIDLSAMWALIAILQGFCRHTRSHSICTVSWKVLSPLHLPSVFLECPLGVRSWSEDRMPER